VIFSDELRAEGSLGLLGVAYLGQICEREEGTASSLVHASPFNIEETINVAAHELGHK